MKFSNTPFQNIGYPYENLFIQCDSFGTRPKKMRISQRLFIRFWTCIYDYIPCFMRSISILVCRSLTSWPHQDNDWRLASCRAQPYHCVVRWWRRMVYTTEERVFIVRNYSETAIFSRMEPHATPRMTGWPKWKAFLMTGLFRKPYGRQDLLT